MPLSNNIAAYADVQSVLTAALPAGLAEYRLATEGKAQYWMHRANKFRQLLQKQTKEGLPKGVQPSTPFDRMKLTRKGSAVVIDFNPQPEGVLSLPTGTVLRPASLSVTAVQSAPPSDDMNEAAALLLKEQER